MDNQLVKSRKWLASDACQCVVVLVFSVIGINCLLDSNYSTFPYLRSVSGLLITNLGIYIILALITLSYAQVRSLKEITLQFGFQRPRLYAALGAALAGASLAGLGFVFIKSGMEPPQNKMLQEFVALGHGGLRVSHWLMLIAPFTEEILLRGYFYKAFRESYTAPVSLGCILGMVVLTHYSAMFSSPVGFVAISGLNIVTSLLREKYDSIWNCILCHFTYNCVWVFV